MAVFCPTHDDTETLRERIFNEQEDDELSYEEEETLFSSTTATTTDKTQTSFKNASTHSHHNCDIISNRSYFPSFSDLPTDNDLDLFYYEEDFFSCTFTRSRNWIFLGQITNNETSLISFLRNRVFVKDRDERTDIPICFYPTEGTFSFETLKIGHTVAVLLAEQHHFLDSTVGLRIEDLDCIKVIPCCLATLISLSNHHASTDDKECWGCGRVVGSTETLKKCAACKTARYCNQTCQKEDWTKRHKKWCKAIPDFQFLCSINYIDPNTIRYWRS